MADLTERFVKLFIPPATTWRVIRTSRPKRNRVYPCVPRKSEDAIEMQTFSAETKTPSQKQKLISVCKKETYSAGQVPLIQKEVAIDQASSRCMVM